MSKHTPGPWFVANSGSCLVCTLTPRIGVYADQMVQTDAEHDARLIAAAPELFEAIAERMDDAEQYAFEVWLRTATPSGDVESVKHQWEKSSDFRDFANEWESVRAALAKATGETT